VSRRRLSEPSFAFLLNAPALLAIVGLGGYPVAGSLWLSLHRYNLKRPNLFRFIGFGNYVEIFGSDEFWAALQVTLGTW
jgi:multiple sugar transport system permease protein